METDTCRFGTFLPTSFPEYNSKTVEGISTKLATLIKPVVYIYLIILTILSWKWFFCCHGNSYL